MRALDPEKLNYDLGAAALRWIAGQAAAGAVLVFLPGAPPAARAAARASGSRAGTACRDWHCMRASPCALFHRCDTHAGLLWC